MREIIPSNGLEEIDFSPKETGFKIETSIILEFYPKSFRPVFRSFYGYYPGKIANGIVCNVRDTG